MYYSIILSMVSSTTPEDVSTKEKLRCNLWLAMNDVRLFLEPSEPNIQALALLATHVEEFTSPSLCWMLIANACRMLQALGRHPNRPGHVHFMLQKEGYDKLTTALYPRGDPYESSDPVFGVKDSLIVDLSTVDDDISAKYNVPKGTKLLRHDFILATDEEAAALREEKAKEALEKLGRNLRLIDGLPVPDVD